MRLIISIFLLILAIVYVHAQTETITDAAGETVVVAITVDPVQGVPSTQTLQTLQGDADETTATTTSTTALNQGPVGAPAATTQVGATTFQYTTTDANGDQVVVDDTFTPSFDTVIVTPSTTFTGTVLDYSSWLSLIGTNTVADQTLAASGSPPKFVSSPALVVSIAAVFFASVIGGVWTVL